MHEEYIKIIRQGYQVWNQWRKENSELESLYGINLEGYNLFCMDFSELDLRGANFRNAKLTCVDFKNALLNNADFFEANLTGAEFREADLSKANLCGANLTDADFSKANLSSSSLNAAYLYKSIFRESNLHLADMMTAAIVESDFEGANLEGCSIYGISVWGLKGEPKNQSSLVITRPEESSITVDNLKVAQFIHLLINNSQIREVIDTVAKKAVLILGRFTPERKEVLDSIRNTLRERDFVPIIFDFKRPDSRDFTETIKILAGVCCFIVADMTNPKSIPLELQATVPNYMIPFVPIIQEKERPFAMFTDLQNKHHWVLETYTYQSVDTLLKEFDKAIIEPALQKGEELLSKKNK